VLDDEALNAARSPAHAVGLGIRGGDGTGGALDGIVGAATDGARERELRLSAAPAGLTARARPEARPETRAAN